MKIYLASSWRNERQPEVVRLLREAGHEVYDFRNPAPGVSGFGWRQICQDPPPWSAERTREVLSHPIAIKGYNLDFDAMKWSDAIVMLQPCGRSASKELGWGSGNGKLTVAILADGQEPELMLNMADYLCVSVDEAIHVLKQHERMPRRAGTSPGVVMAHDFDERDT